MAHTNTQRFALIGGIVMLVMGIAALIPALSVFAIELPILRLEASYGLFLGTFPMNILNKAALIIFGIAGIAVYYRSAAASVMWSRTVFVVMGLAAILGLFPQTNTLMGYWPLFGAEVWTHGLFALLGAYFGFYMVRSPVVVTRDTTARRDTPAMGRL